MMRVVIVGGVAAGMSAATRLRRLDESAEITVLERTGHVSYANCGLPYHVGGVIPERSSLVLQTPESLASRFRIDVRVRTEAVAIDRVARTVTARDLEHGTETTLPYDRLILATGASGLDLLASTGIPVHELRTIDDVDAVIAHVDAAAPGARAIVVGAGFIGVEAVENLRRRGLEVTLVTRGDRVLTRWDAEMTTAIADELERHGVDVRVRTTVHEIRETDVVLDDGTTLSAALVLDARGVRPASALAVAAGLDVADDGGIRTDAAHTTSDPSILAVGDVARKQSAMDGGSTLVALAGPANRAGREAADAIVGRPVSSPPVLGTAIVQVFERTAAIVGWNETDARRAGRDVRVIHTHPAHHAGYYPGAEQMAIKLVVDAADDRILGGQIVGGAGVDRRIDILAVAMTTGLTASALARLELAYAPQYGSAKDPVNLLGMVAENRASGLADAVQWHELPALRDSGAVLVDVRTDAEHAATPLPGAISIPLDDLRERADELAGRDVIVHCQVGQRGHTAQRILAQRGIRARNLDGGWMTWHAGARALSRAARSPAS